MAQAYKCDRCKVYKDGQPFADIMVSVREEDRSNRIRDDGNRQKNVCAPCHSDIIKEIDRVPGQTEKTEKTKPWSED